MYVTWVIFIIFITILQAAIKQEGTYSNKKLFWYTGKSCSLCHITTPKTQVLKSMSPPTNTAGRQQENNGCQIPIHTAYSLSCQYIVSRTDHYRGIMVAGCCAGTLILLSFRRKPLKQKIKSMQSSNQLHPVCSKSSSGYNESSLSGANVSRLRANI